jgi:hypothetical protein
VIDDKDTFGPDIHDEPAYELQQHLWEQILSHASGQGVNWREVSARLHELADQAAAKATGNDEITPEDLPQRPQ